MNTGYSILLGETVGADKVQYRDCERFQIVCPNCREPVFKVCRAEGDAAERHYLAHYAAGTAYAGDCALRVGKMDRATAERQNHLSREQRLAYFLGVLRRTLSLDPMYGESAEKTHYRIDRTAGVLRIRDMVWETVIANRDGMFDEGLQDYLYRLSDSGWELMTSFSLERQRQIARDMWMTITTAGARSNFNFVFNHALVGEISSLGQLRDPDIESVSMISTLAGFVSALMSAPKTRVDGILYKMATTSLPPGFNLQRGVETDEQSTFLTRFLANVVVEMAGTLIQLPYFELLKQQYGDKSKVYPYEPGIQPTDPDEIERIRRLRATYAGPPIH